MCPSLVRAASRVLGGLCCEKRAEGVSHGVYRDCQDYRDNNNRPKAAGGRELRVSLPLRSISAHPFCTPLPPPLVAGAAAKWKALGLVRSAERPARCVMWPFSRWQWRLRCRLGAMLAKSLKVGIRSTSLAGIASPSAARQESSSTLAGHDKRACSTMGCGRESQQRRR